MRKIYTLTAILTISLAVAVSSCDNKTIEEHNGNDSTAVNNNTGEHKGDPREGDMCSVINDSTGKTFGVIKVLKIGDGMYHIRTYGVSFDTRPGEQDIKDLKATPAGIGHLPLSKEQFMQWHPETIVNQPVTSEELEGYNAWKKQK